MNLFNENIGYTDFTKKLTIDGETKSYMVYKIPLDLLYYNDQNDRIATWLSQYKDENKISYLDKSNLERYNHIIHKFITESNPERLKKTQNNINLVGQREPGVVLKDGRIIDGNRRFTCLRNLQKEGETLYFEAVILQLEVENDAKKIKMLELALQHGEDTKVDYNPIDKLVGVYNDLVVNKLLTTKEYARSVNKSESEIEKDKNVAILMAEFLKYIKAEGKFYIARNLDLNGPLLELQGMMNRTPEDKLEDLKKVAFANFLFAPSGDMTRYIRKIKKIIGTEHLDNYLEDHKDLHCHIENIIYHETEKMTDENINKNIRTNDKICSILSTNLAKAMEALERGDALTRPNKIALEALSKLKTIDLRILDKLSKEQKEELYTSLSEILSFCNKITNG